MKIRKRIDWNGTELEYFEKNKELLLKQVFTSRTCITIYKSIIHKNILYRNIIGLNKYKKYIFIEEKHISFNIYYQNEHVKVFFIMKIGWIFNKIDFNSLDSDQCIIDNNWVMRGDHWIKVNLYKDHIFIKYSYHQKLSPPKKYLDKTRKKCLDIFFKFI